MVLGNDCDFEERMERRDQAEIKYGIKEDPAKANGLTTTPTPWMTAFALTAIYAGIQGWAFSISQVQFQIRHLN